jgi:hypothetical protein
MAGTDRGPTSLIRRAVLSGAVLAGLVLSFVAVVAGAEGAASLAGRVGGDFPAFYGAGSVVADGDLDQLYEPERQAEAQAELLDDEGVLYFAYPPPVAAAYSLLARLPYVAAYVVHTVLMAAAMVAAYWLIRPVLPARRPDGSTVAALTFTFLPAFMAVTLGQNSALLVLLVAASWRFARDGRDELAGLALGLLLYKPQYAIPLIGLHLVRRRWRLAGTGALVAVAGWLIGVAMLGWSWTGDWIAQVSDFTALDAEVNGANAVSWLGIAEHVLGVGSPAALVVGGGLAAVTASALVLLWWGRTDDQLALPMAAASVGILLTSPHAMFYDASLLVLTVAGLSTFGRAGLARLVAVGWVLGALHPLKELIGLTPVSLVVLAAFVLVVQTWWRSGAEVGRPATPFETLGRAPEPGAVPSLSVVIPAFDEAGRIEPTLERLEAWFALRGNDAEVIVVDDGSRDDTAERCLAYVDRLPALRVLRLARNRGKGYAVRTGMLAAAGEWRAFLDADGSTDPFELPKLLDTRCPVAIASVAVEDAELERSQSGLRVRLGRFGNSIIQRLVLPGIQDSQRGCKVFRGDVADAVFERCVVDGWGFDVEVLARARALGHEPLEVGVRWEHRPVGHVRPWHYLTTIGEVIRIRRVTGRQEPPSRLSCQEPDRS